MFMYLPVFTTILGILYSVRIRHFTPDWLVAGSMDRISTVLPLDNFKYSPAFNFLACLRGGLLMSFPSLLSR